jgi:hypothetical protein
MPAVALNPSVNLNVHSVNAAFALVSIATRCVSVRSAGISERHQQAVVGVFVEVVEADRRH